jgi:hypothetical protein
MILPNNICYKNVSIYLTISHSLLSDQEQQTTKEQETIQVISEQYMAITSFSELLSGSMTDGAIGEF